MKTVSSVITKFPVNSQIAPRISVESLLVHLDYVLHEREGEIVIQLLRATFSPLGFETSVETLDTTANWKHMLDFRNPIPRLSKYFLFHGISSWLCNYLYAWFQSPWSIPMVKCVQSSRKNTQTSTTQNKLPSKYVWSFRSDLVVTKVKCRNIGLELAWTSISQVMR